MLNAAPVLSEPQQAAQQQIHLDPTSSSPIPASAIPATQPTANNPTQSSSQPAISSVPERAPEHVDIQYTNGQIAVDVTNGNLSQVVHEVARKAGIKVTGSVVDERVFGHYGPASPAVILAALLDGTGSNMLLVDDAKGSSELVLTPRRGGVTPPDPNASSQRPTFEEQEELPESHYNPPSQPFRPPNVNGRGAQIGSPDGTPSALPATPSAPEAGDPNQNGGAKTPQQIYDQLQQMMQQHQSTTPPQ